MSVIADSPVAVQGGLSRRHYRPAMVFPVGTMRAIENLTDIHQPAGERKMKTIILAIATLTLPGLACADVPPGLDSVNGAFVRMLDHVPYGVGAARPDGHDDATKYRFERQVNAAARGELSSLELGFAHMIARADEVPPSLTVRGERDPVERLVTAALQAQARGLQMHARL